MSDTPRPGFDRVKTPRTDAFEYWYLGQGNHVSEVFIYARQLERKLAEAKAEIVRLKGEAESWEKVFDRTCELLAEAKTALAEPKQEPVGKFSQFSDGVWKEVTASSPGIFLYTAPSRREWVGLTDEEIAQGNKESWVTEQAWQSAVWWAEAKLKEKNGG